MCASCVPTCSVPLRLSTAGVPVGTVTLLIDNDELGSVISVDVGVKELTQAIWEVNKRHEQEVAHRAEQARVQKMIAGRKVPGWKPNRQISIHCDSLPRGVHRHAVELLDTEIPATAWSEVSVMFMNGYTARVKFADLDAMDEENESAFGGAA